MTDNRTFIVVLAALIAVIGAIMFILDSGISDPDAQLGASEGLFMAVGGVGVAAIASAARLDDERTAKY